MVILTALIRELHARWRSPVDILTSGPWSEPLLAGQPGVGELYVLRSRKTPYWLAPDQRGAVRWLRTRGVGPAWFCDGGDAGRSLLTRAGFGEDCIIDVNAHPLLAGEHATEQWRRLAALLPRAWRDHPPGGVLTTVRGCELRVGDAQRIDLDAWLAARGLGAAPLILLQAGNKRTMRRGTRRLAVNHKYWPNDRWAAVIRHLRSRHPDHRVVLLGTPPEFPLNAEIAALVGDNALCNAADDLPIGRLVALLERAAALVTVDSGPAHAAAAVGCPQVVLFGRALPSLYRPWGAAAPQVEVLRKELGGEATMLAIEPDDVITAWGRLVLRTAPPPTASSASPA
jgi:heptosyltransferase-2/heptosyltransferase-3